MFIYLPSRHVKNLRRVSEGRAFDYFLPACLCDLGRYVIVIAVRINASA
nr:MAG TPA: hypothetical protein [Caudoviricetes sp.]